MSDADDIFDNDPPPGAAVGGLAAAVLDFVSQEPEAEQLGDEAWRFPFEYDDTTVSVFVTYDGDVLSAAAVLVDAVPHDLREVLADRFAELNALPALGWLVCERVTGVVSARAALDTVGLPVSETMVGNVVAAAIRTLGEALPEIEAIVEGRAIHIRLD